MEESIVRDRKNNGKRIYDWVVRNYPPITWNIIAVIIGDRFLENDINPLLISESTVFNSELVSHINAYLEQKYQSGLPLSLLI